MPLQSPFCPREPHTVPQRGAAVTSASTRDVDPKVAASPLYATRAAEGFGGPLCFWAVGTGTEALGVPRGAGRAGADDQGPWSPGRRALAEVQPPGRPHPTERVDQHRLEVAAPSPLGQAHPAPPPHRLPGLAPSSRPSSHRIPSSHQAIPAPGLAEGAGGRGAGSRALTGLRGSGQPWRLRVHSQQDSESCRGGTPLCPTDAHDPMTLTPCTNAGASLPCNSPTAARGGAFAVENLCETADGAAGSYGPAHAGWPRWTRAGPSRHTALPCFPNP